MARGAGEFLSMHTRGHAMNRDASIEPDDRGFDASHRVSYIRSMRARKGDTMHDQM